MTLKSNPEKAVHDLRSGASAEWLGYRLYKEQNELKASLTEKAWSSLKEKLELNHTKAGSSLRAAESIVGWVSQLGPCFKPNRFDEGLCAGSQSARPTAWPSTKSLH